MTIAINKHAAWGMAALLFLAILPMPYGFYTIVRLASVAFFSYLAYCFFGFKKPLLASACVAVVIVFQPVVKVGFDKEIWMVVDFLAGSFALFLGWQIDRLAKVSDDT